MIEVALIVSNLGLLALLWWEKKTTAKERQELLDAVMSKSAEELVHLKAVRAATAVPSNESVVVPPPNLPVEELTDDDFDKFIQGENSQG